MAPLLRLTASLGISTLLFACSSDEPKEETPKSCDADATGGPVAGDADAHCSGPAQVVDPAACHPTGGEAGAPGEEETPETLYNSEGDDDDCKYHVTWSSTPVCQDVGTTFTVVLTNKEDGSPVEDADVEIEPSLSLTHPAPNNSATTSEGPPGTYTIGPVLFDATGRWTVRFHFFEDCEDGLEESPHGHVGFFLDVP